MTEKKLVDGAPKVSTRSTWKPPRDRPRAKQELPDFLLYPINHAYKKARGRVRKKDDLLYDKKTYGMPPPGGKLHEPPNLDREKRWREEDEAIRRSKMQLVDPATCVGMYENCKGLDINELHAVLMYNPETGILSRRWRRGSSIPGRVVTGPVVVVGGQRRNVFGVIYLLHVGHLPDGPVPLRDGSTTNRSWANIKGYTHAEVAAQKEKDQDRLEARLERRNRSRFRSAADAIEALAVPPPAPEE